MNDVFAESMKVQREKGVDRQSGGKSAKDSCGSVINFSTNIKVDNYLNSLEVMHLRINITYFSYLCT